MKMTCEIPVCALLVGEHEEGRLLLHEVFREAGWLLLEARDRQKALECIDEHTIQVVIASCEAGEWTWKKVLDSLRRLEPPPQLIVTCRTADEQLWSEVLNYGGYDVLSQPFQRDEIERVYRLWFAAFTDMMMIDDEILVDGDRVVQVGRLTGTHAGDFFGLAPTGRHVEVQAAIFMKVADGLVLEERRIYDFTGVLIQVGAVPAPA